MILLDGKGLADRIKLGIKEDVLAFKREKGVTPGLATIQVGMDAASTVYVRKKHEACKAVGITSEKIELPSTTQEEKLLEVIHELNQSKKTHGILIQLPLPKHMDTPKLVQSVSPEKDVDGFHFINIGKLMAQADGFVPCTPQGVLALLKEYKIDLVGTRAVVLGRSLIVGKPMGQLLLNENATVTFAHSKSKDVKALCLEADVLIVACGQPELVKGDWIKPGACVVDVGIHRDSNGRILGDVSFEEVAKKAGHITPVPGGVGPLTIAMLLQNTLKAARALT